jgi:hypothetical protein
VEMAGQTDYGDGSYINYVWRMCGSISATLADALDEDGGDESSCGSWRQLRWGLDRLWRSDNQAAKRARRSKRRESEREAAAQDMQVIERDQQAHQVADAAERAWLANAVALEAHQDAAREKTAGSLMLRYRRHLARLRRERSGLASTTGLDLCVRLLGGDEPTLADAAPEHALDGSASPGPGQSSAGAEEGTPPMDVAKAERAAALTRASGQHGEGTGITLAGIIYALEHVLADRDQITAETTTSDLFKAHVLAVTMPPGWTQSWAEVTNAANSWYTHHYVEDSTGQERTKADGSPDPPAATYSLCAKLAADPRTAHLIGRPTHFVSHAHTYKALEFVEALKNFASTLPPGEAERVFFWIDGFSIDEHQGFYGDKGEDNSAQWANTFKEAVQKMGSTVMVLAPWDHPVVLTRMWCLVRETIVLFDPSCRVGMGHGSVLRLSWFRRFMLVFSSVFLLCSVTVVSLLLVSEWSRSDALVSFFKLAHSCARGCGVTAVGDVLHRGHGVELPYLPRPGARGGSRGGAAVEPPRAVGRVRSHRRDESSGQPGGHRVDHGRDRAAAGWRQWSERPGDGPDERLGEAEGPGDGGGQAQCGRPAGAGRTEAS